MEKFLKVTNAPKTSQLISLSRLKTVTTASGTAADVVLKYPDGTATTVSWQRSQFPVALPLAPTGIVNA